MALQFFGDRHLYSDYNHYSNHVGSLLQDDKSVNGQELLYHCFWQGRASDHHLLSLKSLLVTQSPPFQVWFWMKQEDIERNRDLVDHFSADKRVSFSAYDPSAEARGTVYASHGALVDCALPLAASDGLRHLVLGQHGGIYFDLDVLFLKDIRPLCATEFFYQWSNQSYGNSAFMHFRKHSTNIWALAQRSIRIGSCHPAQLLRFAELDELLRDVLVFPSFTFDPVWICHDTNGRLNSYCNRFDDFFTNESEIGLNRLFPAAHVYHWHNHWDRSLRGRSIAAQLLREVSSRYAARMHGAGIGADASAGGAVAGVDL